MIVARFSFAVEPVRVAQFSCPRIQGGTPGGTDRFTAPKKKPREELVSYRVILGRDYHYRLMMSTVSVCGCEVSNFAPLDSPLLAPGEGYFSSLWQVAFIFKCL